MSRMFPQWMLALFCATLVVGVVGCSDDDDDDITNPPPAEVDEFAALAAIGDDYFTNYKTPDGSGVNVTAATVWANLTGGRVNYHILDWRSAEHFAAGRIQGATNVSLGNFEAVVNAIPADVMVLNVCYTGQSASHATAYMNMLGIDAQNLKFGMCGWTTTGHDTFQKWNNALSDDYADWLETTENTWDTTTDYPTFDTGLEVAEDILMDRAASYLMRTGGWGRISVSALYEDIVTNGNGDDYFILNYFNAAPYDAGHIPGAYRFQPKQDLRVDQRLAQLPTDKKIIVYCYTGQTSSQVVAYLNVLGYDAYSLLYGVNAICHSNDAICEVGYHAPDTDYDVVTE